ncbi:hypothetical protein TNCV_1993651 [Trichonephila clavipes]|nr:hypothetical protein TNCV_1993651 [Trichonephila clavipes]
MGGMSSVTLRHERLTGMWRWGESIIEKRLHHSNRISEAVQVRSIVVMSRPSISHPGYDELAEENIIFVRDDRMEAKKKKSTHTLPDTHIADIVKNVGLHVPPKFSAFIKLFNFVHFAIHFNFGIYMQITVYTFHDVTKIEGKLLYSSCVKEELTPAFRNPFIPPQNGREDDNVSPLTNRRRQFLSGG